MKQYPLMFVAAILYCLTPLVSGQAADSLNLTALIEEAKINNPEIRAFKSQHEASQARISGVRHLKDPMIGVEFTEDMRMYSITQQIPFPTKLSTYSQLARTEADQYEHLFLEKSREILSEVKKSYAMLYLVHQKIKTINESIALLKQLFQVASQKYAVGKATQTDVLRGQVALAKAEEQLLTLTDEKKIAEAEVNNLLDRPTETVLGVPHSLNTSVSIPDQQELYSTAKENRPQLIAFRKMLKKTELLLSIAKEKYLPDFMFRFTQHERDFSFTDRKYMFGFTLPIWFLGKQIEIVKEMTANLKMVRARYNAMENTVLLAVKVAKVNVDKHRRNTKLYKTTIIPQAEANLKSALAAYEANQIDFLSLLESLSVLIQFELEYHNARANSFSAIADLERATGIDLEDDGN